MENTLTLLLQDTKKAWYLVINSRPVGPLTAKEVVDKMKGGEIGVASHVWKEGFENWTRIYDVKEFECLLPAAPSHSFVEEIQKSMKSAPPPISQKQKEELRAWFVYVDDTQYGPFSDPEVESMIEAGRITASTYMWKKGFPDWQLASTIDRWAGEIASGTMAHALAEQVNKDKRSTPRKPFEAKILLTDGKEVGWALCRDISIGGMQMLAERSPGAVGTKLKLNITSMGMSVPGFACEGTVVRVLEDGRGFSFRFTSLPEDAKLAIEKYIMQK